MVNSKAVLVGKRVLLLDKARVYGLQLKNKKLKLKYVFINRFFGVAVYIDFSGHDIICPIAFGRLIYFDHGRNYQLPFSAGSIDD